MRVRRECAQTQGEGVQSQLSAGTELVATSDLGAQGCGSQRGTPERATQGLHAL